MSRITKVLVVDDSAVMRKLITDILEGDPQIEVVGTAGNGADAIKMARKLNPNVITMDIEMPKMDGLTALQHILKSQPLPVIMLSAMDKRQADITMKALDLGAVDFISKTSGTLSLDMEERSGVLISKVKMAANVKIKKKDDIRMTPISVPNFMEKKGNWLITIGASTGGPRAIPQILSRLPRNLPAAVLIVQHMPKAFTQSFAERLNWITSLEVREAHEGDAIKQGTVLVAPGNMHMEVTGKKIHLSGEPPVNNARPSVDVLMKSAAKRYKSRCLGVLLTGMGSDGALGMKDIKKYGGRTIAQNEDTSVVYGMPKVAVDMNAVDKVAPLEDIAGNIIDTMEDR